MLEITRKNYPILVTSITNKAAKVLNKLEIAKSKAGTLRTFVYSTEEFL